MDQIIRATAGDGMIKMEVITARDMVQRAREVHGCTPTAAAALGRTLCAASLLGNAMKEENAALTIRIDGSGPIGSIVAVSDHRGWVRGYVSHPETDLPLRQDGKLDVGGAVGREGMFTVSRDIGLREPYVGSVELVSGEIAEDLTRYLLESEQVASACGLGVLIDRDGSVKAAGGFVVQLMPGAEDSLIEKLEDNIFYMDQLTTILDEDGPETVFAQVLKGIEYHMVGLEDVAYHCPCARERVETALLCVGREELLAMAREENGIRVNCQFCGEKYAFSGGDLAKLLEEYDTRKGGAAHE